MHSDTNTILRVAAFLGAGFLGSNAVAQHAGDIGLRVAEDRLEVYGPIGAPVDTGGIYLAEFGDTGFPGFTSNPGFDALSGTFPPGRIGFDALSGLSRWDDDLGSWLEPGEVDERLKISFITLVTRVEDEPIAGFDLAVQPDGGWHRHVNFELEAGGSGIRATGVYRVDFNLYSTMGLADSNPFTIVFDYEADQAEVDAALASFEETPCPGDLDGDGRVNGADFGMLLAAFGTSDPAADLDGDGSVTGGDVGLLLAYWGDCPD